MATFKSEPKPIRHSGIFNMRFNNLSPVANQTLANNNITNTTNYWRNLQQIAGLYGRESSYSAFHEPNNLFSRENPDLTTDTLKPTTDSTGIGSQIVASGVGMASNYLSNLGTEKLFGDSELGKNIGGIFSTGVSAASNTILNNLMKGLALTEGLGRNTGAAVASAAVGVGANYLGKGITSAMDDSRLGRGIGQGVATGVGSLGGNAVSNLIQYGSIAKNFGDKTKINAFGFDNGSGGGAMNKWGLALKVVGTALGAASDPKREYQGEYGQALLTTDTIYDGIETAIGFIPGWGSLVSGLMELNKGALNIFGSTDGMTFKDAWAASAFTPAPVKWMNVWGSSNTDNFRNLSWLNSEKAYSFMGNSFGNLGDRFDKARREGGKTYGWFSQNAKRRADRNIAFANQAWNKILAMADLNELLNIRSLYMTSINNLRYALLIGGAWQPLARGKMGMKIFNNATNHNIGMRVLSGAALAYDKQTILCNAVD